MAEFNSHDVSSSWLRVRAEVNPKKASASSDDTCNSVVGPSTSGKRIVNPYESSALAFDDPYLVDELIDDTERPLELKVEHDEYEVVMKRKGYNCLFGPFRPIQSVMKRC